MNPLTTKVHVALTIPSLIMDLKKLANRLQVTISDVRREIRLLKSFGFLNETQKKLMLTTEQIHLDEGHPVSATNHSHWRVEALKNVRNPKPTDYHFSVFFSADKEVKKKIKEEFKEFLKKTQTYVQSVDTPEDVYCMTFDLFE